MIKINWLNLNNQSLVRLNRFILLPPAARLTHTGFIYRRKRIARTGVMSPGARRS
jgi:hypothetical protein